MHKKLKLLFIISILLYFFNLSFSQSYTIYHYGFRNGLSNTDILDITQDNDGKMWFATGAGVVSFDGYTWITFKDFPNLQSPPAFIKIAQSNNGNIFALTSYLTNGFCIYKFNGNSWNLITKLVFDTSNYKKGDIFANSFFVNENHNNTTFIISINGFGIYSFQNNIWTLLNKFKNQEFKSINKIVKFKDNYIVATNNGLFLLKQFKDKLPHLTKLEILKHKTIKGLGVEKSKNKLWVLLKNSIGYIKSINSKKMESIFKFDYKLNEDSYSLVPDNYNGVYIYGNRQFFYFDSDKLTTQEQGYANGFTTNYISSAFIDFENMPWFGHFKGVDKLISKTFDHLSTKHGLLGDEVHSIFQINNNEIVLGHRFGITILKNYKVKKRIIFNPLLNYQKQSVLDIGKDKFGNFWFACGNAGLIKLDKFNKVKLISKTYSSSIETLKNGDLVVSMLNNLKKLKNNKLSDFNPKFKGESFIRNIFSFDGKNLYCTTTKKGIYIVNENEILNNFTSKNKKLNNIYFVYKTKNNTILLGTLGGLCTIKNNEIVYFEQKNTTFKETVYSIAEDDEGAFFLGTNKGVFKLKNGTIKNYNKSLGLSGEEVARNAFIIDKNKKLLVGTNHCLNIYNKKYDLDNIFNIKPILKIKSIESKSNKYNLTNTKINNIFFNSEALIVKFVLTSFINETNNTFKYKIEGFSDNWETVSYPFKPEIKIPALSTGIYKIKIKGKNANGIESNTVESPPIIIKRPLEFSLIIKFLTAIILLMGGLILYLRYFAKKRELRFEKIVEKRVNQLKKAETKYLEMFEGTSSGIFFVNLDGKFLDINNSALKTFGYKTKKEAKLSEGIKAHYADLNQRANILKILQENGFVENHKLKIRTIDKNLRIIELSAIVLKDDTTNEPIGYRAFFKDITKEEELQEKLARSEKLEAIGVLAGEVAHDLNNILSGLTTYPEILLMKIGKDSPLRKTVETIKKSGEKAAAMVEDLLTLARRGIKADETINVTTTIKDYMQSPEFIKLMERFPNTTIETQFPDYEILIKCSKIHFIKTFMNLITNAAEAILDNGKITFKCYNKQINSIKTVFENIPEGYYSIIEISDNGIGINKNDIKHIFEPFYTKKKMGKSGTGLGMGVVFATVQDSNGYIDVISEEGKGTTIKLFFPPSKEKEAFITNTIDLSSIRGDEILLVVDDIEEQREGAKEILTNLGYKVYTVSSGENCLEFLKTKNVDLILLDMIMDPGINGVETFIRVKKIKPKQKAIIVSGFAKPKQIEDYKQLGIDTVVKKPYKIKELGVAVRTVLDKQ